MFSSFLLYTNPFKNHGTIISMIILSFINNSGLVYYLIKTCAYESTDNVQNNANKIYQTIHT